MVVVRACEINVHIVGVIPDNVCLSVSLQQSMSDSVTAQEEESEVEIVH